VFIMPVVVEDLHKVVVPAALEDLGVVEQDLQPPHQITEKMVQSIQVAAVEQVDMVELESTLLVLTVLVDLV
jgi:hypothetical protein